MEWHKQFTWNLYSQRFQGVQVTILTSELWKLGLAEEPSNLPMLIRGWTSILSGQRADRGIAAFDSRSAPQPCRWRAPLCYVAVDERAWLGLVLSVRDKSWSLTGWWTGTGWLSFSHHTLVVLVHYADLTRSIPDHPTWELMKYHLWCYWRRKDYLSGYLASVPLELVPAISFSTIIINRLFDLANSTIEVPNLRWSRPFWTLANYLHLTRGLWRCKRNSCAIRLSGKFLYGSNRGHDSLTNLSWRQLGVNPDCTYQWSNPREFNITPDQNKCLSIKTRQCNVFSNAMQRVKLTENLITISTFPKLPVWPLSKQNSCLSIRNLIK